MKKIVIILGIFTVVLLAIATSSAKNSADKTTSIETQETKTEIVEPKAPEYQYEILSHTTDAVSEDVSVLIQVGEPDPQGLANKILDECDNKAKCNVTLYDDKKAYELDAEYTQMLSSYDYTVEDRTTWKEKNTVFLADHTIATVGYSYGEYSDYPLRDSYYEELKNQD